MQGFGGRGKKMGARAELGECVGSVGMARGRGKLGLWGMDGREGEGGRSERKVRMVERECGRALQKLCHLLGNLVGWCAQFFGGGGKKIEHC